MWPLITILSLIKVFKLFQELEKARGVCYTYTQSESVDSDHCPEWKVIPVEPCRGPVPATSPWISTVGTTCCYQRYESDSITQELDRQTTKLHLTWSTSISQMKDTTTRLTISLLSYNTLIKLVSANPILGVTSVQMKSWTECLLKV